MTVAVLDITDFRNLRQARLELNDGLNLIAGPNASGKTSILEALYYLGRTRSFRSRQLKPLIHHQATAFRLLAWVHSGGRRIPIGIQRSAQAVTIRVDGQPARSLAELAAHLPVLLLNPDSHRLLDDGPQLRRRFLDWGLFHNEATFWPLWQRFNVALRQRNSALRHSALGRRGDERGVSAWDIELANAGEQLNSLRQTFCTELLTELQPLAQSILGMGKLSLEYRRGWTQDLTLLDVLRRDFVLDRQQGHTRHGPQRADFMLRVDGRAVSESVSRGQQKLLVSALVLAQARLFHQRQGRRCTLLIDDLPAELDSQSRLRIMQSLAEQPVQLLITAIEPDILPITAWPEANIFRLMNGAVQAGCDVV